LTVTERRRRRTRRAWCALAAAALVAAPLVVRADDPADAADMVVRVGRLHTGEGTVLRDAVIVIENGRFVSVTEGGTAPEGARTFAKAVACPGFVDGVTQIGLDGGAAESPEALTPDVRAADAFDVRSRDLLPTVRAGTTSIGLLPSPSNVAAGASAAAVLRTDGTAEVLFRNGPPVFAFRAPALGNNRVPSTPAGARAMLEAAFAGRVWATSGEGPVPVRAAAIEALAGMRGSAALVYADGSEEARVAVETMKSGGLTPTLVGLRSAWRDARTVADLGVPCVVVGLDAGDPEGLLEMPAELAAAGADVSFSSGAPARSPRSLRMSVALAVAHGFPADQAVRAMTSRPAAALGASDTVGRVADGLRADLLVFDGEPWELRSRLLLAVAEGRVVRDLENDE
jgi:imidazolonepropionase-like amidohydrolase